MWNYTIKGQQFGPVDDAALDQLIAEGVVTADTLVWKEGLAQWTPLRQARSLIGPGTVVEDASLSTCSICGKKVGSENLIDLLGHRVCADCKPVAVQTLREGLNPSVLGNAAWRDGKRVVTYNQKSLPARCYKCNHAPVEPPLKRKVYWHSPAYLLLIVVGLFIHAGLLLYFIVALIVRKKASVDIHLCARHAQRRKYFIIGGWGGAVLGVAMVIVGGEEVSTWLMLSGFAVLLVSMIGGLMGARFVRATRIKGDTVWLAGAGREFLASLPPWTQGSLR